MEYYLLGEIISFVVISPKHIQVKTLFFMIRILFSAHFMMVIFLFLLAYPANAVPAKWSLSVSHIIQPPSDSVVDYIKVLHDAAGNTIGTRVIYKKKPQAPTPITDTSHVVEVTPTSVPTPAAATLSTHYLDSLAAKIVVYPNPTSGQFVLDWRSDESNTLSHLIQSVTMSHSMTINNPIALTTEQIQHKMLRITMGNVVAGVYIIQLNLTTHQVIKLRIIKQ